MLRNVRAPAPCVPYAGDHAIRGFGTQHQIQKLRLKGALRHAFRRSSPPRLQQRATEHHLRILRTSEGKAAQRVGRVPSALANKQRDAGALTSEERTRLLWRYVPDEAEAVNQLRKSTHKWLWRFMKRRDWRRFDSCIDELRTRRLQFDEVTYNLAMFGILLHPRHDDEVVRQVYAEMVDANRFHPTLLRLHGGFIDSYFELKEVDAAPNPWNLRKVAKTFWQISVNFKRQRIKEIRSKLSDAAARQRLHAGVVHPDAELLEDELESAMSDGENVPRVKFPAKRPRQLQGVHKGSGVPNRRRHRWKH